MARLTIQQLAKIPRSKFAGPDINGKPSFPIPDKPHARAALRLSPRSEHAGNITAAQKAEIDARARRMLGR